MHKLEKRFGDYAAYIVCFTAALFFAYELMQMHMLSAIAPMVMKDLHLNATNFGVLGSTYLLADVLFLIPGGIILDRFSIRKVILTAMFLCIAGTFGFAFSSTFSQACFFHFISGIGNAFCFLSCMMLIAKWFAPSKQGLITSLVITTGMLGGFIAQSPFSFLAQSLTWRNALMVDGLIGVFVLFLVAAFVYDKSETSDKLEFDQKFFVQLKECFFNMHNICCGLFISFLNMPLMIIGAVYGSLFLTQIHGVTLIEASFIISMICVGTIIGSPLFGYYGDLMSKKRLMGLSAIASIVIFMTILYMPKSSFTTLCFVFLSLGISTSSQVLGYPLIAAHAKEELVGTSISIGGVLVMGLPMLLGPFAGNIMDMFSVINDAGVTSFPLKSFQTAFLVFPVGFFIAYLSLNGIKEKLAQKASI